MIVGYDHRIAIRRQFATVAAIAIRAALLQNDSAGAWAWSERTVESFSSSRAVVTSTELTSAIRGVDLELSRKFSVRLRHQLAEGILLQRGAMLERALQLRNRPQHVDFTDIATLFEPRSPFGPRSPFV